MLDKAASKGVFLQELPSSFNTIFYNSKPNNTTGTDSQAAGNHDVTTTRDEIDPEIVRKKKKRGNQLLQNIK